MAKAPAVVIVVRHGARLDAADKSWHLTSPTPYDPPLTYGGWVQSRALGLRIASLLHAREREAENNGTTPRGSPATDMGHFQNAQDAAHNGKAKESQKKRKHKVMIHSSPFQRCIQTSVGISAGLSQYHGLPTNSRKGSDLRIKTVNQLHSASPRLNAVDSPRLESIPEPLYINKPTAAEVKKQASQTPKEQTPAGKATLRVDAFLGEWLSPDYFEMITHPPNSTMMVAGAKANLLRKSDDIATFTPTNAAPKATGMWGTPPPAPSSSPKDSSLDGRRNFARRDRSSSLSASSVKSSSSRSSHSPFRSNPDSSNKQESSSYVPPTPTYAVSPADPIPRGYVAHAKDACTNVDYQWDSMREPHYWGDGGNYGEEWSAMHKRFRRGLNNMVEWYSEEHDADKTEHRGQDDKAEADNDDDDDADLVLVLVTHGAGCNALIGALTNQPVLIDVGMASLTMAVRRGDSSFTPSSSGVSTPGADDKDPLGHRRPPVRRNSTDRGLSTIYDIRMVASSEHLRPGVDPANASIPTPSSPLLAAQKGPDYRRRYNSGSAGSAAAHAAAGAPIDSTWNTKEPSLTRSVSTTGPSGMRRGSVATAAPQRMRTYSLAAAAQVHSALEEMKIHSSSPTGLWSSPTMEKPPSPSQDFVLDFSNSPESSRPSSRPSSAPTSQPPSRPSSRAGAKLVSPTRSPDDDLSPKATPADTPSGALTPTDKQAAEEAAEIEKESDSAISDLPAVGSLVPNSLGRSLSQKGLWGSAPSGLVSRENGFAKRRWTLQQEN